MSKNIVFQSDVASNIQETVFFKEVASGRASRTWPVIGLGAKGQQRFLVNPQHATITIKRTCTSIRMDRHDSCAGTAVDDIVRNLHLSFLQAMFRVPGPSGAFKQIA